jgi:hypothetical protein
MPTSPLPLLASPLFVQVRAYLNSSNAQSPTDPITQLLGNFTTADAQTANAGNTQTVTVPPLTTGQEINLTTLFGAFQQPLFIMIMDVSSPGLGFKWYSDSTSVNKQTVAPNCPLMWMADGVTQQAPIYVDNASPTNTLVLAISMASN